MSKERKGPGSREQWAALKADPVAWEAYRAKLREGQARRRAEKAPEARAAPPNAWTPEEEQILREHADEGGEAVRQALRGTRSVAAIIHRANGLGISIGGGRRRRRDETGLTAWEREKIEMLRTRGPCTRWELGLQNGSGRFLPRARQLIEVRRVRPDFAHQAFDVYALPGATEEEIAACIERQRRRLATPWELTPKAQVITPAPRSACR